MPLNPMKLAGRLARCRLPRVFGRLLRSQRGMAAVEFAMVAPIFLGMMLGILQITLIYFAKETLETVTEAAARGVLTGQVQSAGLTQAQFQTAVCASVPALFKCSGLMVDLQPATSLSTVNTSEPTLTFDANGNVTNSWQFKPGASGNIMVLRVMYQWPLFTGPLGLNLANLSNGNLLIMATAVFKNEL
jgi:Flp pilus assembly protein TadG